MWSASIKIGLDAPEAPLGIEEIELGCKKKAIQCVVMLFGPLTVVLVRLQYLMTLKKFERVQDDCEQVGGCGGNDFGRL